MNEPHAKLPMELFRGTGGLVPPIQERWPPVKLLVYIYIGKRPGAARQEADGRGGFLPRATQTLENSRSLSLPARPLAEDEGLASVIPWNPALQEPLDTEADEEEFHDRKSLQLQFVLSRDETQDEAAAVAKAPLIGCGRATPQGAQHSLSHVSPYVFL